MQRSGPPQRPHCSHSKFEFHVKASKVLRRVKVADTSPSDALSFLCASILVVEIELDPVTHSRHKVYLVLWPQALDLQTLSQLVEATVQVPTELHQVLDVKDVGEVDLRTPQAALRFGQAAKGRPMMWAQCFSSGLHVQWRFASFNRMKVHVMDHL